MSLWPLIILVSVIAFVALFFSGRKVNNATDANEETEKTEAHFKLQLEEIEKDQKLGKLSTEDAAVTKAELARELLRHRTASGVTEKPEQTSWMSLVLAGTSLVAVGASFWIYSILGMPDQSALVTVASLQQIQNQPQTPAEIEASADFARLLAQVEQRMIDDPSDVRGWQVLGPAYVRAGRLDEAVAAFRKVLELSPPTPDSQTDLAEVLLMASNGGTSSEVVSLLQSAAASDPNHVRSRFFLAAETTRLQDWDQAIASWNELLALGDESAPWYAMALSGLEVAQARGQGGARGQEPVSVSTPDQTPMNAPQQPPALSDPEQAELINNMVTGLDERLNEEGGTIEEWTRLVRSYIVMGDTSKAQLTYANATNAYPDENLRLELDALAAQAGLIE